MKLQILLLSVLSCLFTVNQTQASAKSNITVSLQIQCDGVRVLHRINEVMRAEFGRIPDVLLTNENPDLLVSVDAIVLQTGSVLCDILVEDRFSEWSAICNSGADMGLITDSVHKAKLHGDFYTNGTRSLRYFSLANVEQNLESFVTHINLDDFQTVRDAKNNFVANPKAWKPADPTSPQVQPTPQAQATPLAQS